MRKFNSILKYILNYRTNSVIVKNFILIMLVNIIPFIFLFINTYNMTLRDVQEDINNLIKPYVLNIVATFDNIYSEMKLLTYTIAQNSQIVSFVSETKIDKTDSYKTVLDIIGSHVLTYKYIDSIYIYSAQNDYILSNTYNSKLEDFSDRNWLSHYSYLERNELAIAPRKNNDEYPYYLSFITPIFIDPYIKVGAVIINVDIEALSKTLTNSNSTNAEVYVFNEYKKLVFCNRPELLYDSFDRYEFVYDRQEYALQHKNDYSLYTVKSSTSNLEYISIVSLIDKYSIQFPVFRMIIISILIVIATLCVSCFLAIKTFKPIGNIITAINAPESQNKLEIDNEIKYILDSINKVANDKHIAEVKLEQRMQLLNNAYSMALQAQINPHFLYNTLETINFLALEKLNGTNEISTITTSLSQMLRYSLDSENKIVPFYMELDHLKLFIQIINIRYKGQCKFQLDISPQTLNLKIVKLILQPIVENAFNHGICPKKGGTITISSHVKNAEIFVIKISDTGIGMSQEKLETLKQILKSDVYLSSKHIGINNVNRRIKMTFGEKYGLSIISKKNLGTEVSINLPIIRE